jgi:putative heme-binding domain-containing protein
MRPLAILLLPFALAFAQRPDSAKPPIVQAGTELAMGKRMFDVSCARCHGMSGVGDLGPPLTRAELRSAPTDSVLRSIIRNGIAGTSMPRLFYISEDDARMIGAYVRSLGRVASEPVNGNAERGGSAYQRLGCVTCHTMERVGGVVGPELTGIGLRRSIAHLRRSITDPGASLADDGGIVEYLTVRIETRDGRSLVGVRINEDGFSIQLRDVNGRFYSFRKNALRKLEKDFKTSVMPSYRGQLTERELDDIVAYLATRRTDK